MARRLHADPVEYYTATEAARVTGMSTAMLNYLCRSKLISPSGGNTPGRGRRRLFMYHDLILLRVIGRLLTNGISVLRLRSALAALQGQGGNAADLLSKRYLATDGIDLYVADQGVWRAISSGQSAFAFVLQLDEIRREVIARAPSFIGARPTSKKRRLAVRAA